MSSSVTAADGHRARTMARRPTAQPAVPLERLHDRRRATGLRRCALAVEGHPFGTFVVDVKRTVHALLALARHAPDELGAVPVMCEASTVV